MNGIVDVTYAGKRKIMKKKVLLALISFACLSLGACGAASADGTSVESSVETAVSSEALLLEEDATQETENDSQEATKESDDVSAPESEEGNIDDDLNPSEDYGEDPSLLLGDDYGVDLENIYYPNPHFRFYLGLGDTENQWPDVTCSFSVGERLIASYEHLDLTTADNNYCFEMDGEEFGDADEFSVVLTSEGQELTRCYSFEPGKFNIYGVSICGEKGELDSVLAGGVLEHIDSYVDMQGTSDIYSEMIITRHIPESHLVSDATYNVEIGLYRLTTLRGTGIMDGDVLHFIPNENEMQVYGDITFGDYDECATFTVTKSEFDYMSVGEKFEFPELY